MGSRLPKSKTKEDKNSEDPYLFEFSLSSNKSKNKIWTIYDDINQKILETEYLTFQKIKSRKKKISEKDFKPFSLKSPNDNQTIDIFNLKGTENSEAIDLRRRKITDEEISDVIEKFGHFDFRFFWNRSKDPFKKDTKHDWAPFDLEDQRILRKGFAIYKINSYYSKKDLKQPADYYIDFRYKMQILKADTTKQRPIIRKESNSVDNIARDNRFFHYESSYPSKPKINLVKNKEKIVGDNLKAAEEFKDFFYSDETQNPNDDDKNQLEFISVKFNVVKDIELNIKINKDLGLFKNKEIIDTNFEEFVDILKKEISDVGNLFDMHNAILEYYHILKSFENSKKFFEQIFKIYTEEGFLYRKLNEFLRFFHIDGIKKLKYFYLSLLASFQYASSLKIPEYIETDKDLILYRVCRTNPEEKKEYENNNNRNIIRIFNEFISTSRNKEITKKFLKNIKDEEKGFIWEIKIPKDFLLENRENFAFIDSFSAYKKEQEVLIKSGTVLLIEEILQDNSELSGERNNIYLKKCVLKNLDVFKYLKSIKFNNTIKELKLEGAQLGANFEYIKELCKGIKENQSVEKLDLSDNLLDFNLLNMKEISLLIKNDRKIKELWLNGNNLDSKNQNIKELCDMIENNKTIEELFLKQNNLGFDPENFKRLCLVLKDNRKIKHLGLGFNSIGNHRENIKELCGMIKNNETIEELFLNGNKLGFYEENVKMLFNSLKENKTIKDLYLGDNEFIKDDLNEKEIKEFMESIGQLKENGNIRKLFLTGNGFNEAIKNEIRNHLRNIKIIIMN